jgi:hypothetical protein
VAVEVALLALMLALPGAQRPALSYTARVLSAAGAARTDAERAEALRLIGEAHEDEQEDPAASAALKRSATELAAALSPGWALITMIDAVEACSGWCGTGCHPLVEGVLAQRAAAVARARGHWEHAAFFEYQGLRARWAAGLEPRPLTIRADSCGSAPVEASACQYLPDRSHDPVEYRSTRETRHSRVGPILSCFHPPEDDAFVHVSLIVGRDHTPCWETMLSSSGVSDATKQCVRDWVHRVVPGMSLPPGHHSLVFRP